jgi:hypothetical protein
MNLRYWKILLNWLNMVYDIPQKYLPLAIIFINFLHPFVFNGFNGYSTFFGKRLPNLKMA